MQNKVPPTPPMPSANRLRLRWWVEIAFVLAFYGIYSGIRNIFGSASVAPEHALTNAIHVIRLERAVGLFQEQRIQSVFTHWSWFMRAWNIFYGTFHFVVTIFAMVYLYRRFPERYAKYRNILAVTTATALIGFSLFPLMPPRLLDDCVSSFGGCSPHGFVDSLSRYGGLWSFDSGAMKSVSNQYAAMPSLHVGWATWCCVALLPVVRNRVARKLLIAYPWVTVFAVIVTANHYWLDALGGLMALSFGYLVGSYVTRLETRIRFARLERHAPARRAAATDATPMAGVAVAESAGPGAAAGSSVGTPKPANVTDVRNTGASIESLSAT